MAYKDYREANKRATTKYIKTHLDIIRVQVKKGMRETYRKQAFDKGYSSLSAYIRDLLEKDKSII